jgi:hypothetical protein
MKAFEHEFGLFQGCKFPAVLAQYGCQPAGQVA